MALKKSSKPDRMTVRFVETVKAGIYRDFGPGSAVGLYLQVAERKDGSLGRSWLYKFRGPSTGKRRWFGIGPWPLVSLARARDIADEARKHVRRGSDPIEQKREQRATERLAAAKRFTFEQCVDEFIDLHRDGWRNKKHAWQWKRTLEFVHPVLGNLPVAAVDKHVIERALRPLWDEKKYETLVRLQQRIVAILDWAASKDRRSGENPAKHKFFPVPSKRERRKHHAALPFEEIPGFAAELRARKGTSAQALEFLLLTAVRSGSARKARWPEMDLQKKIWTVPAAHTKGNREHRVPLSERAIQILNSMPRIDGNDHVFPGVKAGQGLSDFAILKMMKKLRANFVVHGLRSSFKDWASEISNHADAVSEIALEHIEEGTTRAAYARGDLFQKRILLMQDWSAFATRPAAGSKVIPLRRRKAATSGGR